MAAPYIEIGGTGKPAQRIEVQTHVKNRATASATIVENPIGTAPLVGQPVEIGTDTAVLFGGTIDEVTTRWTSGMDVRFHDLLMVSYEQITSRRNTGQRHYDKQAAGDIIKDLVTQCLTSEGINVDDVLDGPEVGPFDFDYITVEEAFDIVAAAAGYYWDILYNKHLRFFTATTYPASFDVTASSANIRAIEVSCTSSREKVANRVYVRLGQYLGDAETETFVGDSSTQQFTLTKPCGAAPTCSVNGTDQTVGILGVDTGKDWYWQAGLSSITQDTGGTPLTGSQTLSVTYTPMESRVLPPIMDGDDVTARAAIEGGSGVYDVVIEASGPTNRQAGEAMGDAYLAEHVQNKSTVKLTSKAMLQAGQTIGINLPDAGINAEHLIESVHFTVALDQTMPLWVAVCNSGAVLPPWQQAIGGGTEIAMAIGLQDDGGSGRISYA